MKRIVTGILLAAAFAWLILYGPPFLVFAAQTGIALLGVWEFFRLAETAKIRILRRPGSLFALALSVIPLRAMFTAVGFPFDGLSLTGWIVAIWLVFLGLIMTAGMLSKFDLADYFAAVAATFLGPIYVAIPLALLVSVWAGEDGSYRLLFAFAVIWLGDTAAYFVGKNLGRRHCAPRISPNKTWEGTIASFVAAMLVAGVTGQWFHGGKVWWELMPLAAALNVAAQLGDLAESALKRSAGVKDSSSLIPGHGGVLDRIDALLFAAPVLWYYWLWHAG